MADQEKARFRGTPIWMDGRYWIVPPLSVRQMEEYEAEQKAIADGAPVPEGSGTLALIQKAMSRNYPDITIEKLNEIVDVATIREAIKAVSTLSGLTEVAPGE